MDSNCYCQSAISEHRDVEVKDISDDEEAIFPKGEPWAVITSENMISFFETEDQACTFQRHWRELMHLDPMTGEFITKE